MTEQDRQDRPANVHLRRSVAKQSRELALKLWVGDKGLDVFEESTFAKPKEVAKPRKSAENAYYFVLY